MPGQSGDHKGGATVRVHRPNDRTQNGCTLGGMAGDRSLATQERGNGLCRRSANRRMVSAGYDTAQFWTLP